MKSSPFKPVVWLMSLIVIVSLACGTTAAPTATQPPPPAAPTNTPVPPPTETPPPPTPTETEVPPTQAPPPTTEAPPPPPPPVESSLPANCVESDTSGYITCYDDLGGIVVDVPDYWLDVNGGEWEFTDTGESIGYAISAAPNLDDFNSYYDAEGMFFGASDTFATIGGYVQFLDVYSDDFRGGCTLVGRYDYDDGVYRGKYDFFEDCGGRGGYDTYVLAAVDKIDPTAMIVLVIIQVMPGDTATVEQIWNTFLVLDL